MFPSLNGVCCVLTQQPQNTRDCITAIEESSAHRKNYLTLNSHYLWLRWTLLWRLKWSRKFKRYRPAIPSVITICLVESPESSSLVFMSIIKWLKIEMTYKRVKNTVRNQNDNKKLMHRRPTPSSPLDNASDDSELCCDTNNSRGFCVFFMFDQIASCCETRDAHEITIVGHLNHPKWWRFWLLRKLIIVN